MMRNSFFFKKKKKKFSGARSRTCINSLSQIIVINDHQIH